MDKLERITIDPEICQGQPVIRQMRITVSFILKMIAGGMGIPEILHSYPELQEEDIKQCLLYAAWLSSERMKPFPFKGDAIA